MSIFHTLLHKILYPKNSLEELRISILGCGEIPTSINFSKIDEKPVIYKNPDYDFYVFILSNIFIFNSANTSPTVYSSVWEIADYKYQFLRKHMQNIFIVQQKNNDILKLFCAVQKHYHALSRFANIWRHKHYDIQISHDLYLNPIDRQSKNVISIVQNGKIYLFTAANLSNIICSSITNAPFFFVEPLMTKNPYNNIPFTKSDLYNIYFFIKQSTIIMPILLHAFFLADFDLRRFRDENENLIRDIVIKTYIYNSPGDTLTSSIMKMLKKYIPEIKIDPGFPTDKLLEIMRPYVHLYYILKYATDEYKKTDAEKMLQYKLKKLYKHNSRFGRKYVKLVPINGIFDKNKKKIVEYNDDHPNFYDSVDMKTYKQSHLEIIEYSYPVSEEDTETEDENNNEENTETQDDETTTNYAYIYVLQQQPQPQPENNETQDNSTSIDNDDDSYIESENNEYVIINDDYYDEDYDHHDNDDNNSDSEEDDV